MEADRKREKLVVLLVELAHNILLVEEGTFWAKDWQLRTLVAAVPQVLATLLPELITRLGDLPASAPFPSEQIRFRLYEAKGRSGC